MLADDAAAESVLSRVNLGRSDERRIHVNMASISAAMADRLAQRFADAGMTYVSAPVLGRPEVAAQGKLNVLRGRPAPRRSTSSIRISRTAACGAGGSATSRDRPTPSRSR